jgi:hypothetical protein
MSAYQIVHKFSFMPPRMTIPHKARCETLKTGAPLSPSTSANSGFSNLPMDRRSVGSVLCGVSSLISRRQKTGAILSSVISLLVFSAPENVKPVPDLAGSRGLFIQDIGWVLEESGVYFIRKLDDGNIQDVCANRLVRWMTGVSNRLESGDLSALALIGDHELVPIEILQHMLAGQAVWDALIEYDEKCAAVGPVLPLAFAGIKENKATGSSEILADGQARSQCL